MFLLAEEATRTACESPQDIQHQPSAHLLQKSVEQDDPLVLEEAVDGDDDGVHDNGGQHDSRARIRDATASQLKPKYPPET